MPNDPWDVRVAYDTPTQSISSQVGNRIRTRDFVVLVLNRQYGTSPKPDFGDAMAACGEPEVPHLRVHFFDFDVLDPERRITGRLGFYPGYSKALSVYPDLAAI
jgi:hypothetical protein